MGVGSVLFALAALATMIAGIFTTPVPYVGGSLSFLAPVLATMGAALGGVAVSRAKAGLDENEALAVAGLVLNLVAFVPAMLVALTCGLCNAMCTRSEMDVRSAPVLGTPWDRDAGLSSPSIGPSVDPQPPPAPTSPEPSLPPLRRGDNTVLPPPPLPPGPAGSRPKRAPADAMSSHAAEPVGQVDSLSAPPERSPRRHLRAPRSDRAPSRQP